jgi:hypothetical protein
MAVAGAGTFASSITSDDLILTAGTLFGAGNTGFSNRLSDTTLYLQMPSTGFNITDNALNTRFILTSAGAATFLSTNLTLQSSTEAEVRSLTTSTGNYANFIVDTNNVVDYRLQMVGFGTTASGTLAGISRAGNGFVVKSGGLLAIGTRDSNDLVLSTNETERMRITSGGAACFACELTAKSLGTNDLILNNLNHDHANYVDGTRGSWLIQEGACDLFIINQVSCKKYKFNLIEIN